MSCLTNYYLRPAKSAQPICLGRTNPQFNLVVWKNWQIAWWWDNWPYFSVSCLTISGFYSFQEKRWAEFPNVTFNFDCTDRAIGFYADLEFDCMIFHMCDEDGRRIPYMCANETSFNQKFRVCDWNYNVDCPSSPDWYYLNDLTYRTDPPKTEKYDIRK